jgi:hypothetical protein
MTRGTLVEDDYYMEEGRYVFTASYHIQRGRCCGNGCRHCPYSPKHEKHTSTLTSGGTLNLYIIAPGYAGSVSY